MGNKKKSKNLGFFKGRKTDKWGYSMKRGNVEIYYLPPPEEEFQDALIKHDQGFKPVPSEIQNYGLKEFHLTEAKVEVEDGKFELQKIEVSNNYMWVDINEISIR